MTIVAGFNCRDGIVLCADTQELIRDYLKVDTPKIEIRPQPSITKWDVPVWAAFAGSGTAPLIDKLIELMWTAAENKPPEFYETTQAMEQACKNYYEELATLYQANDPYYPRAELLYAVSTGGRMGLFKASGPVITKVRHYELSGAGDILAKYICNRMYPRMGGMGIKEAVILALHLLEQTKGNVEGCGGDSHIVVVHPDSQPTYVDRAKVVGAARQLFYLETAANQLMMLGPDLSLNDTEFDLALNGIVENIRTSRAEYKQFVETWLTPLLKASVSGTATVSGKLTDSQ